MYTAGVRTAKTEMPIPRSFLLAALILALPIMAQNPASPCRGEQGLTYICGLVVPEDILKLGSTGLLIASGHGVRSTATGYMYLIDPTADTLSELIHSKAFRQQLDTGAFPSCPGPLNLRAFDVHGLSIAETSPRRFRIYSTSHGEREAIEIYDLDLRKKTPALTWRGCVPLERDGYFNSVAQLAGGGFLTTRMRAAASTTPDGRGPASITGRIFEWRPGGRLLPLAGTELSFPNGIDVSKDGRFIYVAAFGSKELVRFDRQASPISKRVVPVPILPDNIHWDGYGKLLTAGPNPAAPGACPAPPCATGWAVLEVDPETLAFSRLGGADGTAAIQHVSSAMRVSNQIWVGSNDDRIARFTLRRP